MLTKNQLYVFNIIPSIYDLVSLLPETVELQHIHLKPNWVFHEESTDFPIEALVTSSNLIDIVIQACLLKYPDCRLVTIGDVPLQTCDWSKLIKQSGIEELMKKYTLFEKPKIEFLDLRKERYKKVNGFLEFDDAHNGDPNGYKEVVIDEDSFLEEVSDKAKSFRVSDYDPKEITSVHKKGLHKYLISATILDADLIINLPKMKTHQKAGITGALKNLVGINGSKAYLVHHRLGTPKNGGDEFSNNSEIIIRLQVRIRELLRGKLKPVFFFLRGIWKIIKKIQGIETEANLKNLRKGNVYVGAGSWYGNDSIWRMTYDLNRIVLFASKNGGALTNVKQREYIAILDALMAGEGNGPLQPIPVKVGKIIISENPFLVDIAIARLMNFNFRKIPTLNNYKIFPFKEWSDFDVERIEVFEQESISIGIESIKPVKKFIPPPGWLKFIEEE